jgi:hypothetical protein
MNLMPIIVAKEWGNPCGLCPDRRNGTKWGITLALVAPQWGYTVALDTDKCGETMKEFDQMVDTPTNRNRHSLIDLLIWLIIVLLPVLYFLHWNAVRPAKSL